jgi:N-acetylglucosamine-6-phosphate deacetylase
MGTHLFNGMPPFHHRQPGLVGALLASNAVIGVIADGVHVDPLMIDLVVRCAGPGRVALVSDALGAAGAAVGASSLGDQTVISDGRSVRRADGTLAGSAMLLDGCLRNARAWLRRVSAPDVLRMATQTPASAVGAHSKGRVAVGADADLIVLDREWNVHATVLGGEIVRPAEVEVRS